MSVELIPQEIRATPAAIRATIDETRPMARRAAELIRARQPRRIYLIGNGSSYYSSLAASYTARSHARPDDPLTVVLPSGDFRHFMPVIDGSDVVVGITSSGEFRDVLAVFEQLGDRCLRVGITHVPGSTVTGLADLTLISSGGPSAVPVMTKTYASTLTAAILLLLELYAAPEKEFRALSETADRCEEAIAAARIKVPQLTPELMGFGHAFYFGAGSGYAAALEGALKMKEMALLHAEGTETWEMASGPATMVDARALCVALYTGDASDSATAEVARHAREWGARVLDVGPGDPTRDFHLTVRPPPTPDFAPLVLLPPLALLAYHLARAHGATPDRPAWRERYHAQGMTHILG